MTIINRTTSRPTLDDAHATEVDIRRLTASRLVIAAASGAGKSWLLRRLLEQTFGLAQQIVLDPEGEYHTLREKFDYVLAGPGGDCPVTLESAGLLAVRLLELGASAIIDLSELGEDRDEYVNRFVSALMDAPRELWHPLELAVDECHMFAPEQGAGTARSTTAIKRFATAGRKRGFALWAATQRYAELHKTVVAELGNKLIGRMDLVNDIDRARKSLGMSSQDAHKLLPNLEDGRFYAVGRAFTHIDFETGEEHHRVTLIRTGMVATTHPEAGSGALPITPPRARVKQILGQLANLPKEAEAEAKTLEALQKRVRELEATLATYDGQRAREPQDLRDHDQLATEVKRLTESNHAINDVNTQLRQAWRELKERCDTSAAAIDNLAWALLDEKVRLAAIRTSPVDTMPGTVDPQLDVHASRSVRSFHDDDPNQGVSDAGTRAPTSRERRRGRTSAEADDGGYSVRVTEGEDLPSGLSKMERTLLIAILQLDTAGGATHARIRRITGYKPSGPLGKAYSRIRSLNWATEAQGAWTLTRAGHAILGSGYTLHPMGKELRLKLLGELPQMQAKILETCAEAYPDGLTMEQIYIRTGYKPSGPLGAAFAALKDAFYLEKVTGIVLGDSVFQVAADLFDSGEVGCRKMGAAELRTQIIERLPVMEAALLTAVCSHYPMSVSRDAVRKHCGYKPSGPLGAAWKALLNAKYISGDAEVVASKELF